MTSFVSAHDLLRGRKSKCTKSECTIKHTLTILPNSFLKSDTQIQRGVLRHVSHRLVCYFCGEIQRKCQHNTRTRRGAKMDNNRNAPTSALSLILRRSHTGTVWFYTSTSNKRAARPKLYTKSLTRDLKRMYSHFTLVRISINL